MNGCWIMNDLQNIFRLRKNKQMLTIFYVDILANVTLSFFLCVANWSPMTLQEAVFEYAFVMRVVDDVKCVLVLVLFGRDFGLIRFESSRKEKFSLCNDINSSKTVKIRFRFHFQIQMAFRAALWVLFSVPNGETEVQKFNR